MTADERRRSAQSRQLKQSRKLRVEQMRQAEEQRLDGIPVRRVPQPRPTSAPDAWERHAREVAYRVSTVEVDHVVVQVRSRSGADALLGLRVENVGPPAQARTYVALFAAGPALLDRLGGTSRWDRHLEAPWQLPLRRQGDPKSPCNAVWRRTGTYIDTGGFVVTMIRDLLGVADPGRLRVTWTEAEDLELAARTRVATIRARRQSGRGRVLATCEKCARDLRDPYSASVGIGPECIKSYPAEQVRLKREINDAIRAGHLVHPNAKPEATWHQQIVGQWIRQKAPT